MVNTHTYLYIYLYIHTSIILFILVNVSKLSRLNSKYFLSFRNIDIALLRRLEKRIFVDLPDEASRLEILQSYVRDDLYNSPEIFKLAEETEGYSCADLKLLCKEAWINQLRPIWASLEAKTISVNNIQNDGLISAINHITLAKTKVKPITKHMNTQYMEWHKEFGFSK